jgi:hypothetical protein
VALGLSTLSFAAGVAGDLSIIDPPRSGQSVVLRIPPELPADTIHASPLPPLISTAAATEMSPRPRRAGYYADDTIASDTIQAVAEKPPARLEAQLARLTPKSQPSPAVSMHERKGA